MGVRRHDDRGSGQGEITVTDQQLDGTETVVTHRPLRRSEPPKTPPVSSGNTPDNPYSYPNAIKFAQQALRTIAFDVVQVSAFRYEVIARKANSMFDVVVGESMFESVCNRIAEKRARELWDEKFKHRTIRRLDPSNKREWSRKL